MINKFMFREYDIRGQVNENELNSESCKQIGYAFGIYLKKRKIITAIVGCDNRPYAEGLKRAAIEGLTEAGINVLEIEMCTTPMLYFSQYYLNCKGGLMVTASHNPNGWSGLKLADGFSKTLLSDGIVEIYNSILNNKKVTAKKGTIKKIEGVKQAYIKDMSSRIKLNRKIKVLVDCGNGTASVVGPDTLRAIGCEVIEQFCVSDPAFPNHEPDPESKATREALIKGVKKNKVDLGVAYDGDGDRLGVVDELGNNIWSDQLLILLSRQLLEKKPGSKIVFDVKCTQALPEDITAHDGIPIMWKTGHSYIKNKVQSENADLGGERSGHIFFVHGYYGFDDAIFSSLKLIEYLSYQKKTFSQIIDETPRYFITPTYHVDCPDDKKYSIVEKLTEEFKKEYEVIDINGARVLFECGWGLIRASSNLPQLVIVFEAKIEKELKKIERIFREKLSKFSEVDKEWKE